MTALGALRSKLHRHWLGALLFVSAGATGLLPCADGDVWWHLAAGREMVARRELLFTDPFSVSASGRDWTDVHWLFQLATYGVHRWAGLTGLVLAKCALIGLGAVWLLRAVRRQPWGPWAAPTLATWLVLALFLARSLLLVRPVIVTLVCLALFLRELEHYRIDRRWQRLALLVSAQAVWANCQGLSALGPAVVGAYLLGEGASRRPWRALAAAELGCIFASFGTPFGWHGLSLSRALFERLLPGEHNVYAHTIAENVPPFLLERWTGGETAGELWHLKWYCLALGLALVAGGRRLRLSHVLLLVGFGALALLSNRNVLLFYWVSSPIAALQLAPALRRFVHWMNPQRARWLAPLNTAAMASVLALSASAAAHETTLAEPSPFRIPQGSAARLAELPPGDVFCADHHGGYLMWQLFPRHRPYMDTRLVLRSADEYAEYLALAEFPQRFESFQARHHFGYVVLPVDYPNRYLALIAELYRSQDFRLVYSNGSEVLFARRDLLSSPGLDLGAPQQVTAIARGISQRYAAEPKLLEAAQLHLATLEVTLGELERARDVLAHVETPAAAALLARVHYLRGDLAAAEALARQQLRQGSQQASSLTVLAHIALDRGQLPLAAQHLRRALRSDPFDIEATELLTRLEATEP
ncbi:MAG TPA: hypothetical protein VHB79_07915 [Polyangiaceae bacterium]|nr:hypothetical protein [Polyangiaceae bacterium]